MRIQAVLMGLLASVTLAGAPVAQAEEIPVAVSSETSPESALAHVDSFDVQNLTSAGLLLEEDVPDPELLEAARLLMLSDPRLPHQSPSEATMRFSCEGWQCSRVRATVTLGKNGPVVWEGEHKFKFPLISEWDKNHKAVAKDLVNRLAQDYQSARQVMMDRMVQVNNTDLEESVEDNMVEVSDTGSHTAAADSVDSPAETPALRPAVDHPEAPRTADAHPARPAADE